MAAIDQYIICSSYNSAYRNNTIAVENKTTSYHASSFLAPIAAWSQGCTSIPRKGSASGNPAHVQCRTLTLSHSHHPGWTCITNARWPDASHRLLCFCRAAAMFDHIHQRNCSNTTVIARIVNVCRSIHRCVILVNSDLNILIYMCDCFPNKIRKVQLTVLFC
jgi:hypothetical protein